MRFQVKIILFIICTILTFNNCLYAQTTESGLSSPEKKCTCVFKGNIPIRKITSTDISIKNNLETMLLDIKLSFAVDSPRANIDGLIEGSRTITKPTDGMILPFTVENFMLNLNVTDKTKDAAYTITNENEDGTIVGTGINKIKKFKDNRITGKSKIVFPKTLREETINKETGSSILISNNGQLVLMCNFENVPFELGL
jgi:hypothetical protein